MKTTQELLEEYCEDLIEPMAGRAVPPVDSLTSAAVRRQVCPRLHALAGNHPSPTRQHKRIWDVPLPMRRRTIAGFRSAWELASAQTPTPPYPRSPALFNSGRQIAPGTFPPAKALILRAERAVFHCLQYRAHAPLSGNPSLHKE